MADPKHLETLKGGVAKWNIWRDENSEVVPDLTCADLSNFEFKNANFSKTNFDKAILTGWKVFDCNFDQAILTNIRAQGTYWRNANLARTEISGDLTVSTFYVADLTGATVKGCGFPLSELRFLRLNMTKFAGYFGDTVLNSWTIINSDLSEIQNVSSGDIEYPFNIDFTTLKKTAANLKENAEQVNKLSSFFRDCGIPDEIIDVFRSWTNGGIASKENISQTIDFYSCFISYSHQDREFAKALQTYLTKNGIQCWFDEDHVLPGDNILDSVDNGIRKWDKILLCCSKNSLNSPWVDREIDKALQKEEDLWRERKRKILVIIPLNVDGYLFNWDNSKASILKSRLAADFINWEIDKTKFNTQLDKILQSLRADSNARPKNPASKL